MRYRLSPQPDSSAAAAAAAAAELLLLLLRAAAVRRRAAVVRVVGRPRWRSVSAADWPPRGSPDTALGRPPPARGILESGVMRIGGGDVSLP